MHAMIVMVPTNSNTSVLPIHNVPHAKKVEDDEIALAIYEIVLATKAHIPVPEHEMVSYFLLLPFFQYD